MPFEQQYPYSCAALDYRYYREQLDNKLLQTVSIMVATACKPINLLCSPDGAISAARLTDDSMGPCKPAPKRQLNRFSRFAAITAVPNQQIDTLYNDPRYFTTSEAIARIPCYACDAA